MSPINVKTSKNGMHDLKSPLFDIRNYLDELIELKTCLETDALKRAFRVVLRAFK